MARRTLTDTETNDFYESSDISISHPQRGLNRDEDAIGTFDPEMAALGRQSTTSSGGNPNFKAEFLREQAASIKATERQAEQDALPRNDFGFVVREESNGDVTPLNANQSIPSTELFSQDEDTSLSPNQFGDYVDPDVELGSTGRGLNQIGSGLSQIGSGGILTGAKNVFGGAADFVEDGFSNITSGIGGLFGSDPEDTVLPDDLENYTLDDDGNLTPLNPEDPLSGLGSINPGTGSILPGLTATAGTQQQKVDKWKDWRVKIVLPDSADYLYKASSPGILKPLADTNGLIFPYTPTINVQHQANYANYDLTHSNYRGYFYTGSTVQNVMINATFTAQDTLEANYMLAALHFLKSCTKMFYGQDSKRGMPPPVVMLKGLGEYQYNNHPCVVSTMHYNLPNDVDYIAAGVPDGEDPINGFDYSLESGSGHVSQTSKIGRMIGAKLNPGAETTGMTAPFQSQVNNNSNPFENAELAKIYEGKTYVPTKIDISFILLPIQTRDQVSNKFSLSDYASGKLIKDGFW